MKLYIRSIELINIKDSPTECLKEEIKDKNFLCNVNISIMKQRENVSNVKKENFLYMVLI